MPTFCSARPSTEERSIISVTVAFAVWGKVKVLGGFDLHI